MRILYLSSFLLLSSAIGFGQVTSDFNATNDGWIATGASGNAATFNAAGGNPGGYVRATDVGAAYWYFNAPPKFRGNVCSAYNRNLKFDLAQETPGGVVNTLPDLILVGNGITIVYDAPTPAIYPAWTSYSITLNELSGWKVGSLFGTLADKDTIKSVLCNLTSLSIRGRFSGSLLSGTLDNVILETLPPTPSPGISSFAPTSALPGASVTITGTNFNTVPSNNRVYFGGVRATVSIANANQLIVTVPTSARFDKISVTDLVTGLSATSLKDFNPLFDNNKDFGGHFIPSSMDLKFSIDLSVNAGSGFMNAGDLDGDSRNDLIAVENNNSIVSIFRNSGISGDINATSFAPKLSLGLGSISRGGNIIADLDGDGKLDIAVGTTQTGLAKIALFRNTSTPGNLSFAAVQYLAASAYSDGSLHAADIDGDGKAELLSAFSNIGGGATANFSIFQNQSVPGTIEFCPFIDFDSGLFTVSNAISTGDLNGDGKVEIAVATGPTNDLFYIFENTSSPGIISLASLATPFSINSPGFNYTIVMADLDADGKLDLAWKASGANKVIIKKNNHSSGALSAASFSADIYPSNTFGDNGNLEVADMNGDNKPDIVVFDNSNMGIIENIFTSGALSAASFRPGVRYEGTLNALPTSVVIADIDGDNKPDVVSGTSNTLPAKVYIFRNECYPAPRIDSFTPASGIINTFPAVTGDYFFTNNDTPLARIGGLGIPVTSTTNTVLSTYVPFGAISDRVSVTTHGLTGYSSGQFIATFPSSGVINAASFSSSIDFAMLGAGSPGAIAVADYNNDGKNDVIIADNSVTRIFSNTLFSPGSPITNTTLTAIPTSYPAPFGMIAVDVDGDGKKDLVTNGDLKKNNSGSTPDAISFEGSTPSPISGNRFATGDFNKDGKSDFAITAAGNYALFENTSRKGPFTGGATFNTIVSSGTGGAALGTVSEIVTGDFDGDGFDDFAFGVNTTTNILSVIRNTGLVLPLSTSQFAAPFTMPSANASQYIATADLDRDGKLDIILGSGSSLSIFRNTSTVGVLSFIRQDITSLPVASGITGITTSDLDGDGKAEIIVITISTSSYFSIFQNTSTAGTISFATIINYVLPGGPTAIAISDINNDSKPDIVIVRNGTLSVFENRIVVPVINITLNPATQVVCEGSSLNLVTTAAGTTGIIFQWQKLVGIAYADVINGGGYSGATTAALNINTTGSFGAGSYRCKISGNNAFDVFSVNASVILNPITTAPTATGASSCVTASLTLNAIGGTNGQYRWYTVATGGTSLIGEFNSGYTTPSISASTTYYVSINNGTCESNRTAVVAQINTTPIAPTTIGASNCSTATLSLTASGGTDGQYRWYTVASGGTAIAIEVNSSFVTPSISSTTTYYVAINNGTCESTRTSVLATISTPPVAPTTTGATGCSPASVTVTASGGTNGQYRWYTVATGGTAITGEVNSSYVTPVLNSATSYFVAINNGTCESTRTSVLADVKSCASNLPPMITLPSIAIQIEGKVSFDLTSLISDPDNNLDFSTLKVTIQPISKAIATISSKYELIIDYKGILFTGIDRLTIEICDLAGSCTQRQLEVEVASDVNIYTGMSPNDDKLNQLWIIQHIDVLPATQKNHVTLFNRWGDIVFETDNYDNKTRVFTGLNQNGNELPSGTYFYKIEFASGKAMKTGYLVIKR